MISVVIPAYNEQDAIAGTVAEIKQILTDMAIANYEIIIVNDGSDDDTASIAESLTTRVINHPHRIGYGRSLKDGIRQAQYETIIITDADLTYPFNEVPALYADYQQGFDMVVGARTGKHLNESWIKAPLRKVLQYIVEFSAGRAIPDINSGLRIFSKTTVMQYLNHLCDTFSFTTSMTLAYMMTGKFVHYRPIHYQKREGHSKVRLFRDSLRTMQYILQAINYYNPIKLFMLFALLCIVFAMIGFFMSAVFGFHSGFLLGVGGLLIALLVVCFGLIADLLKQIMDK